jgi:hypothetical protein
MAENAEAKDAHAISRLADSGEEAIRNLIALPLRILAGTLGIFEAVLLRTADTLREMDPRDERIVELERRVDSLEEQTTGHRENARSTGASTTTDAVTDVSVACMLMRPPVCAPWTP